MQQHRLTLAAAAVAAAALLGACGTDPSTDDTAGDATSSTPTGTSSSAPAAGLTTDALLTDDDTVYSDGADWFRTSAYEGDGQDVFNPCARESLQGTGATSVVRADFELRNSAADAPDTAGDHLVEVVGEYDDEAAATAAWSTVNGWLEECDALPDELPDYRTLQTRKVDVAGADAVITDSHFGPVPKEADPTGDAAYIMETGVLRKGNHLVVLTSVIIGQDYNFLEEDGGTPVNRMLPKAADRLGTDGVGTPGATGSPAPDAAEVPAPLLPDFDLVHGMLENDDRTPVVATADGRGVGPLEFCDTKLDLAADAEGRLAANASGPEYGEGREVLVLADEAAANAAVESLLEAVRGCAEQEVGGTTWKHALASYDAAAIPTSVVTRSYENDGVPALGLDTLVVAHQGRVVLLAIRSGEGSVGDTAAATRDLVGDLETTVGWVVDSLGS